jgi:hypothetical protein
MTPSVLMLTLVALVIAKFMTGMYSRDIYVCPVCGSRKADGHTDECPWK